MPRPTTLRKQFKLLGTAVAFTGLLVPASTQGGFFDSLSFDNLKEKAGEKAKETVNEEIDTQKEKAAASAKERVHGSGRSTSSEENQ